MRLIIALTLVWSLTRIPTHAWWCSYQSQGYIRKVKISTLPKIFWISEKMNFRKILTVKKSTNSMFSTDRAIFRRIKNYRNHMFLVRIAQVGFQIDSQSYWLGYLIGWDRNSQSINLKIIQRYNCSKRPTCYWISIEWPSLYNNFNKNWYICKICSCLRRVFNSDSICRQLSPTSI